MVRRGVLNLSPLQDVRIQLCRKVLLILVRLLLRQSPISELLAFSCGYLIDLSLIYVFLRGLYVYKISYMHYSTLAVLVVFLVGFLVSLIAYNLKIVKKQSLDRKFYFNFDVYRNDSGDQNDPNKMGVSIIFL